MKMLVNGKPVEIHARTTAKALASVRLLERKEPDVSSAATAARMANAGYHARQRDKARWQARVDAGEFVTG